MLYFLAACLIVTDAEYAKRRDAVDSGCDPKDWYTDADGDGWGTGEPVSGCEAPEGYADDAGDCDDDAAAVNPDATEICDNGIDDDCDGGPGICSAL